MLLRPDHNLWGVNITTTKTEFWTSTTTKFRRWIKRRRRKERNWETNKKGKRKPYNPDATVVPKFRDGEEEGEGGGGLLGLVEQRGTYTRKRRRWVCKGGEGSKMEGCVCLFSFSFFLFNKYTLGFFIFLINNYTHGIPITYALTQSKLTWGSKLQKGINIEDSKVIIFLGRKNRNI